MAADERAVTLHDFDDWIVAATDRTFGEWIEERRAQPSQLAALYRRMQARSGLNDYNMAPVGLLDEEAAVLIGSRVVYTPLAERDDLGPRRIIRRSRALYDIEWAMDPTR